MVRDANFQTILFLNMFRPVDCIDSRQTTASAIGETPQPFSGFEPLTANYIYCPNQFFDICLCNHSRGVVRLVAYILRRTLGWLDEHGNPIDQNITVSYSDLIVNAGISRGSIREAIEEAVAANYVLCVRIGRSDAPGFAAISAQYSLRWDSVSLYTKNAKHFQGFFAGEGNRTPIPEAFFDLVIRHETLLVAKIVGAVLRHAVGYQNQFGGRRANAPLSYSFLQSYANIASRSKLSKALHHAIEAGYIQCVHEGSFHPTTPVPAAYTVNWLIENETPAGSSKREPETSSKKAPVDGFKKGTRTGSKKAPATQFKKGTEEKTSPKNTFKQQTVVIENAESYRILRESGFDERVAGQLSGHSPEQVKNQIAWLKFRNVRDNKLGMLRRAIEEDWSQPAEVVRREKQAQLRQSHCQRESEEAQEEARVNAQKKARLAHRAQLLHRWRQLPDAERIRYKQMAIDSAKSDFDRRRLRKNRDLKNPPFQVLLAMEADGAGAPS